MAIAATRFETPPVYGSTITQASRNSALVSAPVWRPSVMATSIRFGNGRSRRVPPAGVSWPLQICLRVAEIERRGRKQLPCESSALWGANSHSPPSRRSVFSGRQSPTPGHRTLLPQKAISAPCCAKSEPISFRRNRRASQASGRCRGYLTLTNCFHHRAKLSKYQTCAPLPSSISCATAPLSKKSVISQNSSSSLRVRSPSSPKNHS